MLDLVEHHYHLTKPLRKHTLRELRRKVNNIPHVNPLIGTGEEEDKKGNKNAGSSSSPDDKGTLHF